MESWTRVIVEWVNCLGIVETIIDDLQDLKNGIFYGNLVAKLSCKDEESPKSDSPAIFTTNFTLSIDEQEPVSRFIEGEYPEFMNSVEADRNISDDLYIASLFLTQCAQKDEFQRTMCSNLKHETQIHIKKFLELVLPYEKSLTREVLSAAITEIGDVTPNTPPSTPKPSRPLREFFNSPAARSARSQRFMNDRNREIIRLKAQLETERFEKADLMEDMQIQEEKIINLQKKLEIKCQELKALRNEKLKPPTPQSCRKNKRQSDTEERYKRELEEFENANAALKSEIDDLREEREQLSRRIISKDRVHAMLKEKLDITERSLEALGLQIEAKNNELLDMRMNNEQLREHIREIQRSSLGEQSFEMEPIGRVTSPMLMNSSEALSSIVDIQLQEAREESKQVKIQLEAINRKFEETTRECQLLNYVLNEKTSQLTEITNRNEFLLSEFNKAEETIRQTGDKMKHLNDELSRVEEEKSRSLLAKAKLEENAKNAEEKIFMLEANISDCEIRIKELDKIKSEEIRILRDELSNKSSTIDALDRRLKESLNREEQTTAELQMAKNKLEKLTNLVEETKSQLGHEQEELLQKENELARTIKDKHVLEKEIASFVELTENANQRINRLEIELEQSRKNLEEKIATNAALNESKSQLEKIMFELENKLKREENRLELVTNEKNALEKELALSVESTANMEKNLKHIEKELNESNEKLNAAQEKEKIEVNARLNLDKKIELMQHELDTIKSERNSLKEELIARVRSAEELTERIEKIHKNFEESQKNLQEQHIDNKRLRNQQHEWEKQRIDLENVLSQKQKELEAIVGEKKEASLLIDSLKNDLVEYDKKLHRQLEFNITIENEKINMNDMRLMLEKKLESKEQELVKTRAEKDALNEKLSSQARSVSEMEKQIENIEKNLEDCRENLQQQLATNVLLQNEQDELVKQRKDLEEKLSQKQEELKAIVGEKKEACLLIDSLKNDLVEYDKKLHQQLEVSVTIENEKIKMNEMRLMLEKKLESKEQELVKTRAEKDALNEKLSSQARSVSEMEKQIENIEKNLEDCRENLQQQLATNALLQNKQDELVKQRKDLEEKLSQKQEELKAIVGEKKEACLLIDSLKNDLVEYDKKLHQQLKVSVTIENEKIKMNEMRLMLEKKLESKEQELVKTRAGKDALNEKLSSQARSVSEMEKQIENIEKNFEDCRENLQQQLATNALLQNKQDELVKQRKDLEEKLSQKQEELKAIVGEKKEACLLIDSLKNDLVEYDKKLHQQLEVNVTIENENIKMNEMRLLLEKNLESKEQELVKTRAEKDALNEKLSSQARSVSEMEKQIENIEKNLEDCRENLQQQLATNALLQNKQDELVKQRKDLEEKLSQKQEELKAIVGEKKEACLLIDSLKNDLVEYDKKLHQQLEVNVTIENENIKMNEMRLLLEKNLESKEQELVKTRAEKDALNEKLSSQARSVSEMEKQIENIEKNLEDCRENLQQQLATNALLQNEQDELVKQRKDLEEKLSQKQEELKAIVGEKKEASSLIDSLKSQLIDYKNREEKLQETLRQSECEKSQIVNDLKLSRNEVTVLQKRIAEISDCATSTDMQLNELKRAKDLLTENFNERIESLNDLVASLEKRLLNSEKICAEAKLEEKLKEEAIELLKVKLEQLNKEKIESELKMKELIVNLQEVRTSQNGVLEAQSKTLDEKSLELEEAEKELTIVKSSLLDKSSEIDKISQLANELREELTIERNNVKKSIDQWEKLNNYMKNIEQKIANDIKPEFTELFNIVSSVCPEIANLRIEDSENKSEEFVDNTEKQIIETIKLMEEKAKTSRKAVAILVETNKKLTDKMENLKKISQNLNLELVTLRENVEKVCPEVIRSNELICLDNETTDIFYTIETFTDDTKIIAKAVSILTEKNKELEERLENEKKIMENTKSEAEEKNIQYNERIAMMNSEREKRDQYLSSLAKRKKDLQLLVSSVVAKRDKVDEKIYILRKRWSQIVDEAKSLLTTGSSSCDEVKHLLIKRVELDDILTKMNDRHTRGSKPLLKALCRIFVWSEVKLQEVKLVDGIIKNEEFFGQNELFEEEKLLKEEICNNEEIIKALEDVNEKIECFSNDLKSYETGLKVGAIKREASNEEKLQAQIEKMIKERKEMKDKLDAMRTRNAKLEKNMDDLRNENKKLKTQESTSSIVVTAESNVTEIERLEKLTNNLTKEIERLQKDNEQLSKNKTTDEARLKEVHHEYELKLEKIKQKMKTVYNEQIAKLKEEQEKMMKNKVEVLKRQMEQQCQKYTEDIVKYKDHISDLSSRFWDVGEKLLAEKQEKQAALQQLEQLKGQKQQVIVSEANQQIAAVASQSRQKTSSLDRRDFGADRTTRESSTRSGYRAVEMIEEETTTYSTRRRSVQSIQAMGNAFNAEDEEGEVFDSVYLADLKEGRCAPAMGPDFDRISELRTRNSMCRPHLRSAYAVETHVQPITLSEDDIKNGGTSEDIFNDSLSQSLLPGQKPKKKDRTQTSYKRPGPPTPSKNGGRLSLQGNELKSPSRGILKEKNVDRRTTATPRGLKNLFGTSISRRQDENSTSTPKGRRLSSIFRKQRSERN